MCVQYALFNVTPNRIPVAPESPLFLYWPSLDCPPMRPRCGVEARAQATFGNVLLTETVFESDFQLQYWPPLPANTYYTVMLVDMGEPGIAIADRASGPAGHMVVGNVLGGVDVFGSGEVLSNYFPPVSPPTAPEPLLYTMLVYEQPQGRIEFNEPVVPTCTFGSRAHFSAGLFQEKYGLLGPRYGNFFRMQQIEDFGPIFQLFQPCK